VVCARASLRADAETPPAPMRSARAFSIECLSNAASLQRPCFYFKGERQIVMIEGKFPEHALASNALWIARRLRVHACGTSRLLQAGAFRTGRFLRTQPLGTTDHGDEEFAVEQALGNPLGVFERHRIDQAVALVDVVDPEFVEL